MRDKDVMDAANHQDVNKSLMPVMITLENDGTSFINLESPNTINIHYLAVMIDNNQQQPTITVNIHQCPAISVVVY